MRAGKPLPSDKALRGQLDRLHAAERELEVVEQALADEGGALVELVRERRAGYTRQLERTMAQGRREELEALDSYTAGARPPRRARASAHLGLRLPGVEGLEGGRLGRTGARAADPGGRADHL